MIPPHGKKRGGWAGLGWGGGGLGPAGASRKCGGTTVLELLRLENEVWVSPNHSEVFIPCRVQVSFAVVVSFLFCRGAENFLVMV